MRGITGTIRRAHSHAYGQYLIINATGTLQQFSHLEATLFYKSIYWRDWTTIKSEPRLDHVSDDFVIIQSEWHAKCGPNSDPVYDNKSENRSKNSDSSVSEARQNLVPSLVSRIKRFFRK